jgi:hypothetical protein
MKKTVVLHALAHTAAVTTIEIEVPDGQPLDVHKVSASFMESFSELDPRKLEWSIIQISDKPIVVQTSEEMLPPEVPPAPSLIIHP